MKINTDSLVSISEVNQNFSKVARLVDEKGSAVILKNNNPKYVIIEYSKFEQLKTSDEDNIDSIAENILQKNIDAFRELAK